MMHQSQGSSSRAASGERRGQKRAFLCEAAHTVSPTHGANEQTEQSCCFRHEGDRIRSPHPRHLLLSPGVSPSPGFSFGVLARDRGGLVVLAEFLGVAAWEILVRDRLD